MLLLKQLQVPQLSEIILPFIHNTFSVYSVYDPDQDKVIVVYRDDADSSKGKAVVGTVSGTDITFGSEVTFNDTSTGDISVAYDTNTDRSLVTYASGGAEYGTGR